MSDEMITEGSAIPDFTLMNDNYDDISLSDFKDKNIVLYFYPRDNTPGCTTQAKGFSALKSDFEKINTVIIGISKDDPETHERFKKSCDLTITLLSDEDLELMPKFQVWIEKNMYGKKYMGIERSTFLIDKERNVRKVWRKVKITGHVEEVLKEAAKLS